MIYLSKRSFIWRKRSFIWRKRSFIWMARLPPRQAGLHPSPVLETWPRQTERERWVCQILRARSSLLKIPKHRPKPTSSINSALTIWQDKRAQCGWKWPNWKHWQQGGTKCSSQILTKFPRADCCNELEYATRLIITTIIIITITIIIAITTTIISIIIITTIKIPSKLEVAPPPKCGNQSPIIITNTKSVTSWSATQGRVR